MNAPAVIQTVYKGIRFRSRTEARWAVLFDRMGIDWDYELEGFKLGTRWYLPDFYIHDFDMWWEVKPSRKPGKERGVFEQLCAATGKSGVIAYGGPKAERANLWFYTDRWGDPDIDGFQWIDPCALLEDRRDDGIYWLHCDGWCCGSIGGPGTPTDHDRYPCILGRPIEDAFAAAQNERFGA